jgi:hypothetical protein
MKKSFENNTSSQQAHGKSKYKIFLQKQADRLRKGPFTCPLCREIFHGLSAFGSHLKKHCT